jgi:hypothetical protein
LIWRPAARIAASFLIAAGLLASGSGQQDSAWESEAGGSAEPNTLTQQEQKAGWTLLFDGENLSEHWTGLGRDQIPEGHWEVDQGAIHKIESDNVPTQADGQPLEGGDIMTKDTYRDFEFSFEWKVAKGANSGIKYNVSESLSVANQPEHAALGFEYQVLDDERHPDGEAPNHRSAGLYDLIAPNDAKTLNPPGEWNTARIVLDGMHGEHWVNGEKVVEYDMDTARFDSLFAASKYANIDGFRTRRAGHIVLQDHSDSVWFRNLKIRRLSGSDN